MPKYRVKHRETGQVNEYEDAAGVEGFMRAEGVEHRDWEVEEVKDAPAEGKLA